jgi:hypothetical protein
MLSLLRQTVALKRECNFYCSVIGLEINTSTRRGINGISRDDTGLNGTRNGKTFHCGQLEIDFILALLSVYVFPFLLVVRLVVGMSFILLVLIHHQL